MAWNNTLGGHIRRTNRNTLISGVVILALVTGGVVAGRGYLGEVIRGAAKTSWADLAKLPGVHQSTATTTPTTVELRVSLFEEPAIGAVVQSLVAAGGHILSLKKTEPTLEDVFIELVGHGLSEGEPAPPAQGG